LTLYNLYLAIELSEGLDETFNLHDNCVACTALQFHRRVGKLVIVLCIRSRAGF